MKRKAIALTMCMTSVLLLGLSQCKKQETPITPTPEETEEGIYITLDVEDGGRHVVIPGTTTADVNYTFGDKIYVGDGSKYIGTLTNTGSTATASSHFEGIILSPSDGTTHLHFYFVGGLNPKNPEEPENPVNLIQGSTTSFAVDISNQSNNLPVLSYGNAPYVKGNRDYTCMLENKCALVKFGLNYKTTNAVSVADMVTQATINFGNPIDYSDPDNPEDRSIVAVSTTTGSITLYSQDEKTKWAILLPQDEEDIEVSVTIGTETYSKSYNVTVPDPGLVINAYNTGITIDNRPEFSVSNSTKVMFSKGNLQYQASSATWRFAENQWEFVGNNDNNNAMSATSENWIDLFGWGTWGSSNPLNISTESGNYTWCDFTDPLDGYSNWRTLSLLEWNDLLIARVANKVNNVPNAHYAKAMVNNVAGLIVFSDNYSQPLEVTPPANINEDVALYTGNNYSADEWNILADYGAIFLPAAGKRTVTTETTTEGDPPTTKTTTTINVNDAGSNGYYWTSASKSFTSKYYVGFGINDVKVDNTTEGDFTFGCAVRLVRDIE